MDNYFVYNDDKREKHTKKLVTWVYSSISSTEDKEPEICKHFGCGMKLTRQEKLFGNKCVKHSKL